MSRENNREEKGGRKGGRESASGDKKKDSYKAKRSFTRNKTFRSTQNDDARGSGKKSFASHGDRPWKSKPGEERKKFGESFGRDEKSKPRAERAPRETKEDRERKYQKRLEESGNTDRPERARREGASDDRQGKERKRDRPEDKRPSRKREERTPREFGRDKAEKSFDREKRSGPADEGKKRRAFKPREGDDRFARNRDERGPRADREKSVDRPEGGRRVKHEDFEEGRGFAKQERSDKSSKPSKTVSKNTDGLIRLNKYLSNAGIASRREADNLILSGTVKVNGVVADQLGTKIKPTDKVTYGDAAVKSERKVYLLLNKPKDYITTVDDPRERKTVMELIAGACRERVYPVGRLDRNTTGLLLFTNDGELTTKLTHPKFGIKKVYHVSLNKGLKPEHFKDIIEGIELEDGPIKADDLAFVGEGKKEVGIEVHSGRNRIVRRIFEHLGYDVLKLDRVVFAGLTKKDLPRGKHRFLTAKEISFLQMIG